MTRTPWQRRRLFATTACDLALLAFGAGCEQVLGIEDLQPTDPPTNGTLWQFPLRADGYRSFEVRVRPMSDPFGVPYGLLNALQFELMAPVDDVFPLDSAGYVGLHSDPDGKRVEFVIWGARAAVGPFAQQACDGTVLPCAGTFDNEDGFHGAQASIAYHWRAERDYTLRVTHVRADPEGDWWEATVTQLGTEQQTRIGLIQAQPTWQGLSPTTTTWFELYGPNGAECDGAADLPGTFQALRAEPDPATKPWSLGLASRCNFPVHSFD